MLRMTSIKIGGCVCPVIDHQFRHSIVKLAVDPPTILTMLSRNSLSITGQMHEKLTSILQIVKLSALAC